MPVDLDHIKPFMGFCTAVKYEIYLAGNDTGPWSFTGWGRNPNPSSHTLGGNIPTPNSRDACHRIQIFGNFPSQNLRKQHDKQWPQNIELPPSGLMKTRGFLLFKNDWLSVSPPRESRLQEAILISTLGWWLKRLPKAPETRKVCQILNRESGSLVPQNNSNLHRTPLTLNTLAHDFLSRKVSLPSHYVPTKVSLPLKHDRWRSRPPSFCYWKPPIKASTSLLHTSKLRALRVLPAKHAHAHVRARPKQIPNWQIAHV